MITAADVIFAAVVGFMLGHPLEFEDRKCQGHYEEKLCREEVAFEWDNQDNFL